MRSLSGFICIVHGDNAPIDRALLQSLTDFLSFRGPDAQNIWMDHSIGMGHTLLRTTHESKNERQPLGIEERYWIVADARLDAREELIAELRRAERQVSSSSPDCELVLQAYATWGEACVDHLAGDFSFAIWDKEHKKLFCARDHFGVKPFYYASLGSLLVLSNTLNCIRLHPSVRNELNDQAVGDFLLFGLNCDNTTTVFRDIQRLPPANALTTSRNGLQRKRYWAPPTDGRIRYSKPQEYIENFLTILEKAVSDRLRTDRLAILLSGGLDSSSVTAVAKQVSARNGVTEIRGYTHVYGSLIPDTEKDFAGEVGAFLRIPVNFIEMDEFQLYERWDDPQLSRPEPVDTPFLSAISDTYNKISKHCRVLLSGEGADNLMDFQMWPYVRDLRRQGEWRRLLADLTNYLRVRHIPWRGIRARAMRSLGKDSDEPAYPKWLAPDFARRGHLLERWKEQAKLPKLWRAHPIHPRSHGSLSLPQWTLLFEQEDPGVTTYPVETRYPFLDLRVMSFLLAVPPFPWFFKKTLLREAMKGRLPERVRTRPKTPLPGDPTVAQVQRNGLSEIPLDSGLERYINRSALVAPHAGMNQEQVRTCLRPYSLNIWLQSSRQVRYKIYAEARNG